MDLVRKQRRERIVHESMALHQCQAAKACGHDSRPKVPTAAGSATVAGVGGAFIEHHKLERLQAILQQRPDLFNPAAVHRRAARRWPGSRAKAPGKRQKP